jgi:hypothetical protein
LAHILASVFDHQECNILYARRNACFQYHPRRKREKSSPLQRYKTRQPVGRTYGFSRTTKPTAVKWLSLVKAYRTPAFFMTQKLRQSVNDREQPHAGQVSSRVSRIFVPIFRSFPVGN